MARKSAKFIPKHFPLNTWSTYLNKGYKLQRFLALPQKNISSMSAEEYLANAIDILMSTQSTENSSCVAAKVFAPNGRVACLRLDRDYFDIYLKSAEGITTMASWQFAKFFRDFSQEELWCNMAMLLNQHEPPPA